MKNSKGRHSRRMTNTVETLLAVLIACMSILVVVLLCAIGIKLFDEKEQQPDFVQQPTSAEVETQLPSVTENTDSQEETTQPDDRLPYLLEEGKLGITSLFQYTGLNPDAYWEEGTNVGAIILTNHSEEYLTSLNLTVTMSDGSVLYFLIQDLPAGKTVWAYEIENSACTPGTVIQDVQCTSEYAPDNGIPREQVAVSISGMDVTLTNQSDTDLNGLEIRCHNVVEGAYFGGTAYAYPVDKLAAGATVTVTAYDCFMGELDVARADYTN